MVKITQEVEVRVRKGFFYAKSRKDLALLLGLNNVQGYEFGEYGIEEDIEGFKVSVEVVEKRLMGLRDRYHTAREKFFSVNNIYKKVKGGAEKG